MSTTSNRKTGHTTSFESMHQENILGKLTTVDRMMFNGYLNFLFFPGYFKYFLCEQGVLLKDFGRYAQKATDALKNNARQIAAQAGRPYMYLRSTVLGKDDLAKKMAKRDGVEEGLICVLATLEMRTSFSVQPNHKTHKLEVARQRRKCLHYYFYFIDPEFGFMHARIQSWFPFEIQVYINGREWLARQLDQRKIGYTRYENTFLQIDDLKTATRLCERLGRLKWPRFLNVIARRINPCLPIMKKYTGRGYYWVIDECEVATDVMWRNRASLQKIMPYLFDHAIHTFSADDVMRFLGRKLTGLFKSELITDQKKLNPVGSQDCSLFRAAVAGEHLIQGFRNRDLQIRLYAKPPSSPQEAKRRCAPTSRLIAKLRAHKLVAKVPRSTLYRITPRGHRLMSAAIRYREVGLPDQLATAA